jgi:hypothetical protein
MDKLLDLVKGVAPTLATALGGPLAGAAVGMLADKLGVPEKTVEAVTAALVSNPANLEKLKEMELEFYKIDAQDRSSARTREVEMAKADVHFITKNITSLLAIGILAGSMIIALLVFFVDFPDSQENILIFVLGSLFSIATQVVSYYFGSSQGSKDKTKDIEGMMKR